MRRLTFVVDVPDGDLEGSPFPTERSKVQAFVDEAAEVGLSVVLLKIDGENLYERPVSG